MQLSQSLFLNSEYVKKTHSAWKSVASKIVRVCVCKHILKGASRGRWLTSQTSTPLSAGKSPASPHVAVVCADPIPPASAGP